MIMSRPGGRAALPLVQRVQVGHVVLLDDLPDLHLAEPADDRGAEEQGEGRTR
jgi:hypothetical protein